MAGLSLAVEEALSKLEGWGSGAAGSAQAGGAAEARSLPAGPGRGGATEAAAAPLPAAAAPSASDDALRAAFLVRSRSRPCLQLSPPPQARPPPRPAPQVRAEFLCTGFVARSVAVSETEAAALHARFREYAALLPGGRVAGDFRFKAHLLLPWLWDLVHSPRLMAAVEAALGTRHLLCWSTDFFEKAPGGDAFTGWHQDSTYVALEPADGVCTAWVAFTPSTEETGCLWVVPGSNERQLRHEERPDPRNILLKAQTVAEPIPGAGEGGAVPLELRPGEFSLHHSRLVHRSGANRSPTEPRVGVAIRRARWVPIWR